MYKVERIFGVKKTSNKFENSNKFE